MKRLLTGVLGVLVAVVALPLSAEQAPAAGVKLAEVPIDHVGIVVRDIDAVAKAYADVFGLPVPAVQEEQGIVFPADFTGDREASVKTALLALNGVSVELIQPMGGASPWRDHLDKYGESMHHISYHGLPDAYAAASKAIDKGGQVVVGGPGATTVMVDLREKLGMTIGFSELPANPSRQAPAEAEKFADNLVSYTSVIVPDTNESAELFAEITGAEMPNVFEARISYPEDYTGEWTGHPTLGMVALGGWGLRSRRPWVKRARGGTALSRTVRHCITLASSLAVTRSRSRTSRRRVDRSSLAAGRWATRGWTCRPRSRRSSR